jgi:hypothetical protein
MGPLLRRPDRRIGTIDGTDGIEIRRIAVLDMSERAGRTVIGVYRLRRGHAAPAVSGLLLGPGGRDDSADTDPASDTQPVVVAGEEEGETFTPPPTSTITTNPAGDGSSGMLLVLLAIAGLVTVLGVLTPAPARARRRSRRG